MSENSSKIASKLTKVENKLRRLQESYNALIKNYDTLKKEYLKLAACHTCIVENSEEIETQKDETNSNELDVEMVPLDVDQNLKDPIEFLPEHCAVEIFKNLTGKELMTSMRVSKFWRDFINDQGVLMGKIVFKPTNESCDFLIDATNDEGNLRRYKHYEGPFYIHNKYEEDSQFYIKSGFKKVYPIKLYASSLETAVIESPSHYYDCAYDTHNSCDDGVCPHVHLMKIKQNFAQLQKLTIQILLSEELDMLVSNKFTMLTYLSLTASPDIKIMNHVGELKKFICLFPKLQTLVLNYIDDDEAFPIGDDTIVNNVPKIKEFSFSSHSTHLVKEFYSSLERYEVEFIYDDDLRDVLRDFKRLKSLSIADNLDCSYERIKFETNKSIEALYIGKLYLHGRDDCDRRVMDILIALPSIKKLFYGKLNAVILKFIANNMLNLKQLGCHIITVDLREAYEEIQRNPENYLNTDFELIVNMPWDKMQYKFYSVLHRT